MLKRIAILFFLLLCCTLAACSQNEKPSDEPPAPVTVTDVTPAPAPQIQAPAPAAEVEAEPEVPEEPIPPEPVLTEINHYVMDPAAKIYTTDERIAGYKKALDAIIAHEPEVYLSESYDDNLAVRGYLMQSPYSFLLSDDWFSEDHTGLCFEYAYSAEECTQMVDLIDQEYLTIINENITSDMTDLEKVLAIHKYFANRIAYDYEWLEQLNLTDDKFLYPDIVIYQALTTNKGVCHTYTFLCQFAFQQLDIDCLRLSTYMQDSNDAHMWPLVWIDGTAFHIDPTWDRDEDQVSLRYFGMTDEENVERGIENSWSVSIDTALDGRCTDHRFESWRDIVDYTLLGNHQMQVIREDGSSEIIDLMQYSYQE